MVILGSYHTRPFQQLAKKKHEKTVFLLLEFKVPAPECILPTIHVLGKLIFCLQTSSFQTRDFGIESHSFVCLSLLSFPGAAAFILPHVCFASLGLSAEGMML